MVGTKNQVPLHQNIHKPKKFNNYLYENMECIWIKI